MGTNYTLLKKSVMGNDTWESVLLLRQHDFINSCLQLTIADFNA